jgi:hypothetical protein
MFALFGGKSYAIFALLFGLTFQLQNDARARRGEDFRPRFAWRMLLLLGFGMVNSAFYQGDILSMYAVLGFVLIPVARLRTRTVFLLACFLSLQPFAWFDALAALDSAPGKLPDPASWALYGRADAYLKHGSAISRTAGTPCGCGAGKWAASCRFPRCSCSACWPGAPGCSPSTTGTGSSGAASLSSRCCCSVR